MDVKLVSSYIIKVFRREIFRLKMVIATGLTYGVFFFLQFMRSQSLVQRCICLRFSHNKQRGGLSAFNTARCIASRVSRHERVNTSRYSRSNTRLLVSAKRVGSEEVRPGFLSVSQAESRMHLHTATLPDVAVQYFPSSREIVCQYISRIVQNYKCIRNMIY